MKPFKFRSRAKGTHKPGRMNGLESRLADELRVRQIAGEVQWFAYEGIKLRLADNTHYTPDFLVMMADGSIEVWEAKGFWHEDARVKVKVAAELFPFVFRAFRRSSKTGNGWDVETFGGHE
jgi:hypothetical protein